jgi:hypothetical protein
VQEQQTRAHASTREHTRTCKVHGHGPQQPLEPRQRLHSTPAQHSATRTAARPCSGRLPLPLLLLPLLLLLPPLLLPLLLLLPPLLLLLLLLLLRLLRLQRGVKAVCCHGQHQAQHAGVQLGGGRQLAAVGLAAAAAALLRHARDDGAVGKVWVPAHLPVAAGVRDRWWRHIGGAARASAAGLLRGHSHCHALQHTRQQARSSHTVQPPHHAHLLHSCSSLGVLRTLGR